MRNFLHIVFFGLTYLGLSVPAYSQKKDSIYQLQQVDLQKNSYKEVIPAQTLSGVELERLNSHSVADALRFFSGIQIKDYGGIGGLKTINIRSMGSQHVGVFYDGIQLGNAQNGVVDLGRFSLDDMEEIALYNGQKSEIFQPAKDFGSSGSVYLTTKKPVFKGNETTHGMIRYKTSTIQLFNPSIRLEQKINDQLALTLSSEFMSSNGVYPYTYRKTYANGELAWLKKDRRRDGQIESKRYELGLNGKLHHGSWNFKSYNYMSDRGIPSAVVKGREDTQGQTLADRNHYLQGDIHKRWGNFETQLRGKFAYDYTHYMNPDSTNLIIDNTYLQREVYISSANTYKIKPNWDISLAYDFQYNTLDANLVDFSYPERFTNLFSLATAYQWNRLKVQGSILGTFVTEKVKKNTSASDKNEWSPALFLSYQPLKEHDFHVRAFYKHIFRMPTFNDLYYTNIGYSNLKPEFTTQYNLGTMYSIRPQNSPLQQIALQVDAYYNQVDDKIIAAPGGGGSMFRWVMMNLDKVKIKGVDINVRAALAFNAFRIEPKLSYTYQKAQDYSDPTNDLYKNQIPYVPVHSGSAVINSMYKDWALNYSFIYVGERYDVNKNNIVANRVNAWFTHDLSLQKEFKLNPFKMKATAEVNNVFDQQYDVVIYYPMPGRHYKFSLSIAL